MRDRDCVSFLQWALSQMRMRWPGFRKVRRQVCKRVDRRLGQLGIQDVAAYREYPRQHPHEWSVLDEFCRISISRFYRDRGVFDLLRDEVLPSLVVAATGSSALLVLANSHRFMNSVEIVQALARQVNDGKQNRTFIVVLSPMVDIPVELEKSFVVIEHDLPGRDQLEEICRGIAAEDGELPADDESGTVLDAAAGLTRF